ncbi:MAG: TetR/AcrR family transcriptional regulator C-terminal domain-containing protein, partial [Myxococcota bacterium]
PDVAALVRLVIAESPHHPALSQMLYDHGKGPMASPLRGYLIEQCDAGVLDVPDLDLATRHFMAMIEGSVLWRSLLQGDMATAAHLDAVVQSATATFLARFRVPCPP